MGLSRRLFTKEFKLAAVRQHPPFLDALQAPLQKINLQGLLTDLAFQLGDPASASAIRGRP